MKPKHNFLGIGINETNLNELLDYLVSDPASVELVNPVNVRSFNIIKHDERYRSVLQNSEVVFCDGFGVKLFAKLCGVEVGERMTPPDWIDQLYERCITKKKSIFLLGDEEWVVNQYRATLEQDFPDLMIAGSHRGHLIDEDSQANALAEIQASRPDIILTAMSMPIQEIWADDMREKLHPCKILATGALFRWNSGIDTRPPKFLTDHGLEWLARLVSQPGKVWKRYLIGLPSFALDVLVYHLRHSKPHS